MVDLPFVCDRDKATKKSLTAPPPAVRIHLLASSRDHSSDAQAYGAADRDKWAGVLSATLLHSLRAEQTWGQLLEDVRAHIRRSKLLVLPILSSTAPLDLSAETQLV